MSIRALALLLLISVIGGLLTYALIYFFVPTERPGMGYGVGSRYTWIPIISVPVIFVIGLLAYSALFPEIKQKPSTPAVSPERQESLAAVLKVLKDDEKKVVELLMNNGGTMLQRDIGRKTGFSRVKTHRILYRLAARGIVTAEKYYNTYKITLAEWLFPKK
jgi:uncharacterized membrane protein